MTLIASRRSMARYPAAAWSSGSSTSKTMPGVDLAGPDPVDQVGQESPDGGGAAVQVHVGEEQLYARQRGVVGDADAADVATGSGGADGLHHRLLGCRRPR